MAFSLIVCERTGKWMTMLRRVLPRGAAPVCQTRSLSECHEELEAACESIVAIEVTVGNLPQALNYLERWHAAFPDAVAIVLAEPGVERYESLLREAGSVHVARSTRDVQGVADIVKHCSARYRAPRSQIERISASLPWPDVATM